MKSKAFWLLGLVAIAAMALAACGGAEEAPAAAPAPAAPAAAPAAPAGARTRGTRTCGTRATGSRTDSGSGRGAAYARTRNTDGAVGGNHYCGVRQCGYAAVPQCEGHLA